MRTALGAGVVSESAMSAKYIFAICVNASSQMELAGSVLRAVSALTQIVALANLRSRSAKSPASVTARMA